MKSVSIKVSDSEIESTLEELKKLGLIITSNASPEWCQAIFLSKKMYITVYGSSQQVAVQNHCGGHEVVTLKEFKKRLRYGQDKAEG